MRSTRTPMHSHVTSSPERLAPTPTPPRPRPGPQPRTCRGSKNSALMSETAKSGVKRSLDGRTELELGVLLGKRFRPLSGLHQARHTYWTTPPSCPFASFAASLLRHRPLAENLGATQRYMRIQSSIHAHSRSHPHEARIHLHPQSHSH